MPLIVHDAVPVEAFPRGSVYQTVVGDDAGSTPVRVGIQTSPPGYTTAVHSHPYMEIITVLAGVGEAWHAGSDEIHRLEPGVTLVIPPGQRHWLRATGDRPFKTYGVHVSSQRIVDVPLRQAVGRIERSEIRQRRSDVAVRISAASCARSPPSSLRGQMLAC